MTMVRIFEIGNYFGHVPKFTLQPSDDPCGDTFNEAGGYVATMVFHNGRRRQSAGAGGVVASATDGDGGQPDAGRSCLERGYAAVHAGVGGARPVFRTDP